MIFILIYNELYKQYNQENNNRIHNIIKGIFIRTFFHSKELKQK